MTFTASLSIPEDAADRLAQAIAADVVLEPHPVAFGESADGLWELVFYFTGPVGPALRRRLDALAADMRAGARFTWRKVPDDIDWVARSLEGLPAIGVGRFLVHGGHQRRRRIENLTNIEIEAAQAFGTGHHGTTAGCLVMLERIAKDRRFTNALDLGTGSGVLAIALAKAWRVPVLASDIDPVAVRSATENSGRNSVAPLVRTVAAAGFRHPAIVRAAPFDLIVANILAGPLAQMAPLFPRFLDTRGVAILSGILPDQARRVLAAFRNAEMRLMHSLRRDGWVILAFERPDRRQPRDGPAKPPEPRVREGMRRFPGARAGGDRSHKWRASRRRG